MSCRSFAWILVLSLPLAFLLSAPASAGRVELVSRAGTPGPAHAVGESDGGFDMSGDGRFVVFLSTSPNLVPGQSDGNNQHDLFLWDRTTGEVRLVSHRSGSATTTADAGVITPRAPQISTDGRWITFCSAGFGLIPDQEKTDIPFPQIYLYDRITDTMTLVSRSTASPVRGAFGSSESAVLSSDGRYIAFISSAGDLVSPSGSADTLHVYLYDRVAGTTVLASHASAGSTQRGNGGSGSPALSADGRWVAYSSSATDLVAGMSDGNGQPDLFLFDRDTGSNALISHAAGSPLTTADNESFLGPQISADGAWVVFASNAGNLVAGQTDTISSTDIFLWERATGTTRLVSHASGSATTAANAPSLWWYERVVPVSADGAFVTFSSPATDLVAGAAYSGTAKNVFLFDRSTGANTLVSHAAGAPLQSASPGDSDIPTVSADGSHVFFSSRASNLIPGGSNLGIETNLFAWNRATDTTALVSHTHGSPAAGGNSVSQLAVSSEDVLSLAFRSRASDLAGAADTNEDFDLFHQDLGTGATTPVSFSPAVVSVSAADESFLVSEGAPASADGRFIVFLSQAKDLVPGQVDTNQTIPGFGGEDVFLYDRQTRETTLVSRSTASPATAGNAASSEAAVSRDGRYVAFVSRATDLVPGQMDQTGSRDVFVFDRMAGTTLLASGSSPTQAACSSCEDVQISGDGRYIAYWDSPVIFIFDQTAGTRTSFFAGTNIIFQLSDEGRYIAFTSTTTNLVPGQSDTNGGTDVFLYDRVTASYTLVSRSAGSSTATGNGPVTSRPVISADGRFVSFASDATNHVPGQVDSNSLADAFLFDRETGTVTLVSRSAASPVTAANGFSLAAIVSKNGRFVLLASAATDLVPGQQDTPSASFDLFLFDRLTGAMSLVSHRAGSLVATGNQGGLGSAISADGNRIAFWSASTDLIDGLEDANLTDDLFLYDRLSGSLELVTRTSSSPGTTANAITRFPWISDDGQVVFFESHAGDLAAGDFNLERDVFAFVPEDLDFYTLEPCRLFDSRRPEDGPALNAGFATVVEITGACGIPPTARAVALNVTAVQPTSAGYLTLYPGDGLPPLASSLNFDARQVRANNAVVRLAPSGSGTLAIRPVLAGGGSVHVVIDVVGFFE